MTLRNTADILAGYSEAGIAAKLADDYSFNGFDDWFLPSSGDLNEMYINRGVVGGFVSAGYWSSSEADNNEAFLQAFTTGGLGDVNKTGGVGVRAIRIF